MILVFAFQGLKLIRWFLESLNSYLDKRIARKSAKSNKSTI